MLPGMNLLGGNLGIKRSRATLQSGQSTTFAVLNTIFVVVCDGAWYLGACRWSDLQEITKYAGARFTVELDGMGDAKVTNIFESTINITLITLGEQ